MKKYKLLLRPSAVRDLKKLNEPIHERIIRAIVALSENPRKPGAKKLIGTENEWRIRIGNYRVLYEIDEKSEIVRIFRIAHRKEVYR